VSVALVLSAVTYSPGDVLLARLQNRGTAGIYFGYEFVIERWIGSEWITDPSTPVGWPLVGLGLSGGAVGTCERAPLGGVAGLYRMSKMYSTAIVGPEVAVRTEFRIGS
jgi:hypothetical protein